MDPTELVREFIEYYRKGNYVEATESAFDLLVWMEKGGFDPDWSSVTMTCFDRTEAPQPLEDDNTMEIIDLVGCWLIDLDDVEEENMSDLVKILSVDHHRNGSGGLGFSIVRFTNLEGMYGPFMAFITDTQRYHPDQVDGIECFVLDTSRLPDVCFVDNGWRGDVIFSELLKSGLWSTDRFKFVKKDSAEELAWDLELGLWVPWKRATGFTAAQCKVLGKVNSDGEWQYYEDSGDDGDE